VEVRRKGELLGDVRPLDVSQLAVFGNVQVSTQLLRELFAREVPVCFFSHGGGFSGLAHGLPSKHVELHRRQVAAAATSGLPVARAVTVGKIRNSRTLLRRNARQPVHAALARLAEGARAAEAATSYQELLGLEGAAARTYFESFCSVLREEHRLPGAPSNGMDAIAALRGTPSTVSSPTPTLCWSRT
jgi:CRISPR-associated protein Cas1